MGPSKVRGSIHEHLLQTLPNLTVLGSTKTSGKIWLFQKKSILKTYQFERQKNDFLDRAFQDTTN